MSLPVRGQRSLPIKLKIKLQKKGCVIFFIYFSQKISCLTFSTLKKFGFGTAVGLGDMHNFHHFGDIWALLVLLKSTVSSFVKYYIEGHLLYRCKPWKILFNMTYHNQ